MRASNRTGLIGYLQVVVDGGAGEQQAVAEGVAGAQRVRQAGFVVLQPVALVHHDVVPRHLAEDAPVLQDVVVVREEHVEVVVHQIVVAHLLALLRLAVVQHHLHLQGRGSRNDQR
eukprot:732717-Prorocentrum_minimum.AAC.5